MNNNRPYFGEMTDITPVGPNIQNFEVPGVIVVISPTPNFQVPGVIKPQKSGVIATLPCTCIFERHLSEKKSQSCVIVPSRRLFSEN